MKYFPHKFFKPQLLSALLVGVLCFIGLHPASAQPTKTPIFAPPTWVIPSVLEMAQNSDAVIIGQPTQIGKETSLIAVTEVLKGQQIPAEIEVAPSHGSTDVSDPQLFDKQEEVMLFLTAGKNDAVWHIYYRGWATIHLRPEIKQIAVEAVKPIVALPTGDQEAINRAMLTWVTSDNYFLRDQAQDYVWNHLDKSKASRYKENFLAMTSHADGDVRKLGLSKLHDIQAPEALPLCLKATADPDAGVRATALNCLRDAQAPEVAPLFLKALEDPAPRVVLEAADFLLKPNPHEVITALTGLTKNPDLQIQLAAIRSLSRSQHPEARDALAPLLDSPEVRVRTEATLALAGWVERDQADAVLPKLIALLKDPVRDVQTQTLSVLDKSHNTSARVAVITYRRLHS